MFVNHQSIEMMCVCVKLLTSSAGDQRERIFIFNCARNSTSLYKSSEKIDFFNLSIKFK